MPGSEIWNAYMIILDLYNTITKSVIDVVAMK